MKSKNSLPNWSQKLIVLALGVSAFAIPTEVLAQNAKPVRLSTIQGITKIQNQDVVVTVVFAVPPGENARANGRRALQSIQPGAREIDSSAFVLTGSVWDQFSDNDAGNDFVEVNYNGEGAPSYLDSTAAATVFTDAMEIWNAVPSSSFVFEEGFVTTRCPSLVNECKGGQYFDGLNDVTWLNIRERNVLGVTWSGTTVDEFDMAIDNRDFNWFIGDPANIPNNAIDLLTVVTHEFGHAAGIGHSEIEGAVMEAFYEGPRRELSQDDIDALTFLYPAGNDGGGPDPEPDPTPDTDPPTIIDLASAKLHPKNGRFEITWTTEEAADSEVRFISPVTDTFTDAAFVSSHRFAFRGQSGTRYVYEVISTDAAGNQSSVVQSVHDN